MTSPDVIRADSLLAQAHLAGFDLVVVTAKDKLVRLLAHQLPTSAPTAAAPMTPAPTATCVSMECLSAAPAAVGSDPVGDLVRALLRGGETLRLSGHSATVLPSIYDPLMSVAVVEAGGALARHVRQQRARAGLPPRPVLCYSSTTDYVQHKHAPFSPGANAFYSALDGAVAQLLHAGRGGPGSVLLGLTADHGMSDKCDPATGAPRIVFVEQLLREAGVPSRVILPITDAHVVHHGALGGYATVYVGSEHMDPAALDELVFDEADGSSRASLPRFEPEDDWKPVRKGQLLPAGLEVRMSLTGGQMLARRTAEERVGSAAEQRARLLGRAAALLRAQCGVQRVLSRSAAAELYDLPNDNRIGDLVVVAEEGVVLGRRRRHHDLSQVAHLRSHGGESERTVPLLFNRELGAVDGMPSFMLLPLLFRAAAADAAATAAAASVRLQPRQEWRDCHLYTWRERPALDTRHG